MVWRRRDCSWLIGNPFFANLTASDFKCASDPDDDYNCIAWAADRKNRPWWPTTTAPYFWPPGLPKTPVHVAETLPNFIKAFEMQGYRLCRSRRFSRRYEKVAIFVHDVTGRPTHAARMLPNGMWSSKMGTDDEDIEHSDLKCIQGMSYGKVKVVLKRPINRSGDQQWIFRSFLSKLLERARGKS